MMSIDTYSPRIILLFLEGAYVCSLFIDHPLGRPHPAVRQRWNEPGIKIIDCIRILNIFGMDIIQFLDTTNSRNDKEYKTKYDLIL